MFAVFRVMARGQGKTSGFHERQILVPASVYEAWDDEGALEALAEESAMRVKLVSTVRSDVLRSAILFLVQERLQRSGPVKIDRRDLTAQPWLDRLDREVDRVFFTDLFRDLENLEDEAARDRHWQRRLFELLEPIYFDAVGTLVPTGPAHYRAIARAEAVFYSRSRQYLPGAFPDSSPPEGTDHTFSEGTAA